MNKRLTKLVGEQWAFNARLALACCKAALIVPRRALKRATTTAASAFNDLMRANDEKEAEEQEDYPY